MNIPSLYWKLCRLSLTRSQGYEVIPLDKAQIFCHDQLTSTKNLWERLLTDFYHQDTDLTRALAGLCLRCYVSYPIVKACQKLANLFSSSQRFTYRELLPFVLNDDGQELRILDFQKQQQLRLDEQGTTQSTTYAVFALEILRTYQVNHANSMSLENWAYLQTKQNKEVKAFLAEYGFQNLSDWALLNRARKRQIEQLSSGDRHLVIAFHEVYRRDRRQQGTKGAKKCPDPTEAQLREILTLLKSQGESYQSTGDLFKQLKQVAKQFRQYDIWQYRESLDVYDPETGSYHLRADLPKTDDNEVKNLEQQDFIHFLKNSLKCSLTQAIETQIQKQIAKLKKSRKYSAYADQFITGLCYYYYEGKSLKEIASLLEMSSWDQARRILNPGELVNRVRTATVQQLLESVLNQVKKMGFVQDADYLKNLANELESYVDQEIFNEAIAEMKAGKNRTLQSIYAQSLRDYLKTKTSGVN